MRIAAVLVLLSFISSAAHSSDKKYIDLFNEPNERQPIREASQVTGFGSWNSRSVAATVCLEKYLFAVVVTNGSGPAIIQIFEEREGKSLPKRCE